MNPQQRNFLKIISVALTGHTLDLQGCQLEQDWTTLHRIGSQQKLWPMIYDQLYRPARISDCPC